MTISVPCASRTGTVDLTVAIVFSERAIFGFENYVCRSFFDAVKTVMRREGLSELLES